MTARKWSGANSWSPDERRHYLANVCDARSGDGTGAVLRCVLQKHGSEVPHTADGMQWRDGEAPRGMMGVRATRCGAIEIGPQESGD